MAGAPTHTALLVLTAVLSSCSTSSGGQKATRLVGGTSDTVIINHLRPVQIPVRVFDRDGKALPDSGVRFYWVRGDSVSVSERGAVTCIRSTDAIVRGVIGSISNDLLVRCRPVDKLYVNGPIQFLLPDTAQEMQLVARGLDGQVIDLLNGRSEIVDTAVATIDGIRVVPRSPGSTVGTVRFGNRSAGFGVHVYERVSSLNALEKGKQFVGIPLRLSGAETRTWRLPAGSWMLTMLPESDESAGLRLRVEGGSCSLLRLTKRRYGCYVKTDAKVIVFNPAIHDSVERTGQLLVRPVYN